MYKFLKQEYRHILIGGCTVEVPHKKTLSGMKKHLNHLI